MCIRDRYNLLEKFVFDIELNNKSHNRLSGFYTINEETLHNLTAEQLAELNKKGFLKPLYMAVASLLNMGALIKRKNKLL